VSNGQSRNRVLIQRAEYRITQPFFDPAISLCQLHPIASTAMSTAGRHCRAALLRSVAQTLGPAWLRASDKEIELCDEELHVVHGLFAQWPRRFSTPDKVEYVAEDEGNGPPAMITFVWRAECDVRQHDDIVPFTVYLTSDGHCEAYAWDEDVAKELESIDWDDQVMTCTTKRCDPFDQFLALSPPIVRKGPNNDEEARVALAEEMTKLLVPWIKTIDAALRKQPMNDCTPWWEQCLTDAQLLAVHRWFAAANVRVASPDEVRYTINHASGTDRQNVGHLEFYWYCGDSRCSVMFNVMEGSNGKVRVKYASVALPRCSGSLKRKTRGG
jgi:hypothetical protein